MLKVIFSISLLFLLVGLVIMYLRHEEDAAYSKFMAQIETFLQERSVFLAFLFPVGIIFYFAVSVGGLNEAIEEAEKARLAPVATISRQPSSAQTSARSLNQPPEVPIVFASGTDVKKINEERVIEVKKPKFKPEFNTLFLSSKRMQKIGGKYLLNFKFNWEKGPKVIMGNTTKYSRSTKDILIVARAPALDMTLAAKYIPYDQFIKNFSASLNFPEMNDPEHVILYACRPDTSSTIDICDKNQIFSANYLIIAKDNVYALHRPIAYFDFDFMIDLFNNNNFHSLSDRKASLKEIVDELNLIGKKLYPKPPILGPGRLEISLNTMIRN